MTVKDGRSPEAINRYPMMKIMWLFRVDMRIKISSKVVKQKGWCDMDEYRASRMSNCS